MSVAKLIAEPGIPEIQCRHVFNAPREMVFRLFTDPDLIPLCWGPRRLTTMIEKMEVKPGGSYRFIQRDSAGNTYAFHGVYHEVKRPERLVYTFEYEGTPGHVLMETTTFNEKEGRTEVNDQLVFQSVGNRDQMIESGMEEGYSDSMERMTELLKKLQMEAIKT